MKKELILLAGTKETRRALAYQLDQILGKYVKIHSYSSEERLPKRISNQLVIYSSYLIHDEVKHVIEPSCHIIISHRTINYEYIDLLFEISHGTSVLYVNDFPETVNESIQTLKRLGIDHINYIPYFPGREIPKDIDIAVTPGELELVPETITKKINIGVRLIDINTVIKIADYFELPEELSVSITDKYTRKIINLSRKLSTLKQEAVTLNQYLKRVVDGVNDGILAFDVSGSITVFNEALEKMTGIDSEYAVGKHVNQVFKNIELLRFLLKDSEYQQPFTVRQVNVMVHRFPIKSEETIVVTFKDMDETIEMEKAVKLELQKKGYVSKYTFKSILGVSQIIHETIHIAKKLAKTDLPILIQGESGTGKELFASAIHAESKRNNAPFLGINCNALPEELLESELFGYEEGAFTGARKGGKKGLFEQADGGTLFLDEIGDISMKLQARLLRVLQEWEVRKIGGNKNIPINVRIIAATNKDLKEMIEKGQFREDLYHRLKVLFLSLPALRHRREDIPLLIEAFIDQSHKPKAKVDSNVINHLAQMNWNGNIRELKNTIQYMLAVSEGDYITLHDLPIDQHQLSSPVSTKKIGHQINTELMFLLKLINDLNETGQAASRKKLCELSTHSQTTLTEQQVRLRIKELEKAGFVVIHKGRFGTQITERGKRFIE